MKKRKFKNKKMNSVNNIGTYKDVAKNIFSGHNIVRTIIILFSIVIVLFVGMKVLGSIKGLSKFIATKTVDTISASFGEPMIQDEYGNVNVLLLGHGGQEHEGGLLADSIMVASWNPKLGAITFISVPRDLYIYSKDLKIKGKINSLFASAFYRLRDFGDETDKDKIYKLKFSYAAEKFSQKVADIMGLDIPYFAIVDFKEFENLIDNLGGITVDVPYKIYDTKYPLGERERYVTFSLDSGVQTLDGATALKYARSRHSTSDFSRSQRQQLILKAIIDKVLNSGQLSSVSKMRKLYDDFSKMVYTNVSAKEMIGMMQYKDNIKHIFSFVFTTECSYKNYEYTSPGCFLYTPLRENFGGSSVLLPIGASVGNVSFYKYMRNFVFFVAHNQKYLIENKKIVLENGIDKDFARKLGKRASGHIGKLAVKLKKYAFNIVDIGNADTSYEQTVAYVAGEMAGADDTINMLKTFFDIPNIFTGQLLETGVDMKIIIGNDYLEKMGDKKFNYEM